jgi:hypothetical protein
LRRRLDVVTTPSKASDEQAVVPTRAQAAAEAIASVRAEGLDPGRADQLLSAWGRGELTDEQLEQARLQLLGDSSLTVGELLADARAA